MFSFYDKFIVGLTIAVQILYAIAYVWNLILFIRVLTDDVSTTKHVIIHGIGLFGFAPITVWF
ncbi:hypothetical protein KBA63_04010 [Candidatus Woesebacteria bacterium]|nr:hypothetical protein [Candidatus Woesebacteria bacterium]